MSKLIPRRLMSIDLLNVEEGKQRCALCAIGVLIITIICASTSTCSPSLFSFSIMPFNKECHCSNFVKNEVGLDPPAIVVPRIGDKSRTIEGSPKSTQVCMHMDPLNDMDAKRIWHLTPENIRNSLPTDNDAIAVHTFACNAGFGPTDRMNLRIPHSRPQEDTSAECSYSHLTHQRPISKRWGASLDAVGKRANETERDRPLHPGEAQRTTFRYKCTLPAGPRSPSSSSCRSQLSFPLLRQPNQA